MRKDSTGEEIVPGGSPQAPLGRDFASSRTQLGELLVGAQLVTHDQLAQALLQQGTSGKRIGTLLVELGAIDERDLAKALSTQLHVPLVDLSQQTPTPEAIARELGRVNGAREGKRPILLEQVSGVLAPEVGEIGWRRAQAGGLACSLADSLTLDANYVRRTDAELKWKGI